MPRVAREISKSGMYHIIMRGINKQDIFYDKQDYKKMIKEIRNTKEKHQFMLYSYVLMPNHVHLEIKADNISEIMHRIGVSYVAYFNKKYERVGHLFQDRYKSKPVETEQYLLNLMRYIHQNPMKAKIGTIENYLWSSYQEYINKEEIVDTEVILNLFDFDKKLAKNKYKKYNQKVLKFEQSEKFLEYEILSILSDEQLAEIIKNKIGMKNLQQIQQYNKKSREKILEKLKMIKGVSKAQMARVLGLNKKIIEREMK